jgi:hypothetical protein
MMIETLMGRLNFISIFKAATWQKQVTKSAYGQGLGKCVFHLVGVTF